MLTCEGYKMFYGTMEITPRNPEFKPFIVEGTWLYKPEYGCWYCKGQSYMASICKVIEDRTEVK